MIRSKTVACVLALSSSLSACVPLYTTTREWKAPPVIGNYTVSATMNVGLLISDVTIFVNGRQVLAGQSWFWSDNITLEGAVDHVPIAALCHIKAKDCDVTLAGLINTRIKF